jgi:polysaccharide biosynthesis protein PslH
MSKPRVLMIARCPPYPLHLGDRLIVYHVARELQALGVTLDLLAFAERPSDWSLGEQQHYSSFFHDLTLVDAQPRPTPEMLRRALLPSARFPAQARHAFAPHMYREIERHIATHTYDGVHLFGGVQVYEFARCLNGLKTVITPYESYALYLRRAQVAGEGGMLGPIRWWAARQYESWMFEPYDVITVLSEPDRAELIALNPAYDVRVIPNGIDAQRFAAVQATRDPAHLLFVGNYDYPPNLDAALWLAQDIFPRVRSQHPAARLSLVGNAPPPALQALADDHITVTGRVPDVQPYLDRATAFVCPLRFGAGIKNKVLEALASGCPLIATPVSVDGISVTDGQSALIAQDAPSLAAATIRVLADPTLQTSLREQGRAVVMAGYTWGRVAQRYAALYQSA